MAKIRILGKDIKVKFKRGEGAPAAIVEAPIMAAALDMAALINSKPWKAELALAYTGLKAIVFFNGAVKINGHMMSRPGIDEKKATFFWEVAEFDADDADGHANTLFHDGWHVVQYKRAGNKRAIRIDERVAREVDATDQQIKAARILGSAASDIAFLKAFRDAPGEIRRRLLDGVG